MRRWTLVALFFLLCSIPVGKAAAQFPFETAAPNPGSDPVSMRVVVSKPSVRPGDQIAIGVIFELAPGWHLHTREPKLTPSMARERFVPIPTVVGVTSVTGATVGPIQWPEEHVVQVDLVGTGRPEPYAVYKGFAPFYIPVMVSRDTSSDVEVQLELGWQACDDRFCQMPQERTVRVLIPLAASDGSVAGEGSDLVTPAEPAAFAQFDVAVFGRASEFTTEIATTRTSGGARFNVFGREFTVDTSGGLGVVMLLFLAMLGGFVLNLTPCVLPVIPIKIMGLSQAAANPSRCLMLGIVMSLGVIAFWLAIGAAISFIAGFTAVNTLFQQPWFSIVVSIVIAIMALGMLGLFAARLPQWVYRVNPSHDSVHGSFLFGIMTAVLSTPCTAPFMGSAAAWATQQQPIMTLSTFGAIGLGMALPYLLLAANPKWVNKVPRTGPASELVKQVMGLLMLAVAAFFLGTGIGPFTMKEVGDPPLRAHWWLVAAFAIAASAWTIFKTFRITRRPARRALITVGSLVVAGASVLFAIEQNDRGPIAWQAWTPERFEAAKGTGKVIVVDFTAEWCLNCKALEAGVLHRKEVASVLNGEGVIAMKVDITAGYPEGVAFMKELEWANIPLLAIFGPGLAGPIKYDSYTPATVLEAIRRASGGQ
ncbi:MAG: thioredoxin family protein [Phycisphaeraceae bacterium]|nr:MAG: thioredoxin family protein [Phycisphaeraceae bacterium]